MVSVMVMFAMHQENIVADFRIKNNRVFGSVFQVLRETDTTTVKNTGNYVAKRNVNNEKNVIDAVLDN